MDTVLLCARSLRGQYVKRFRKRAKLPGFESRLCHLVVCDPRKVTYLLGLSFLILANNSMQLPGS